MTIDDPPHNFGRVLHLPKSFVEDEAKLNALDDALRAQEYSLDPVAAGKLPAGLDLTEDERDAWEAAVLVPGKPSRHFEGFDVTSQMVGTVETSVTTAVTPTDKFTLSGGTFSNHAEIIRLVKGGMGINDAVRKVRDA